MKFKEAYMLLMSKGERSIEFPTIQGGYVDVWASRLRSGYRIGTKVIRIKWAQSSSTIDEQEWQEPQTALIKHLITAIVSMLTTEQKNYKNSEESKIALSMIKRKILFIRQMDAFGMVLSNSEKRILERHPLDMSSNTDKAIAHLLEAIKSMEVARKNKILFTDDEIEFVKAASRFLIDQNTEDMFIKLDGINAGNHDDGNG